MLATYCQPQTINGDQWSTSMWPLLLNPEDNEAHINVQYITLHQNTKVIWSQSSQA